MNKKLNIYNQKNENNTFVLDIEITDNGDLKMSGCDIGDYPQEVWGNEDYEYSLTIEKDYKDDILLWLIKERFQKESDFQEWLNTKNVPNKFSNWV